MDGPLAPPVHLYVKTHRATGLKYFGRTTRDPHSYLGSGAYWLRHIEKYGNNVETVVLGTFSDPAKLRAAATDFSERYDVANSFRWANLLPEDGSINGKGWLPGQDHSQTIAALDEAVETCQARQRMTRGDDDRVHPAKGRDLETKTLAVSLLLVSFALGMYMMGVGDGYAGDSDFGQFVLGFLMGVMTPLGWIPAGFLTWVFDKLSKRTAQR